jgi:hypothetical protein
MRSVAPNVRLRCNPHSTQSPTSLSLDTAATIYPTTSILARRVTSDTTTSHESSREHGTANSFTHHCASTAFQVQQCCGKAVPWSLQSGALPHGFPRPRQPQLIPVHLALSVATLTLTLDILVTELFYGADKIFRHVWNIKIGHFLYKLTLFGRPRETRKKLESAWLDKLIPIGSGANFPRLCALEECLSYSHRRPVGLSRGS